MMSDRLFRRESSKGTPAVEEMQTGEGKGSVEYYYDTAVIIKSAGSDQDAIDCHHH